MICKIQGFVHMETVGSCYNCFSCVHDLVFLHIISLKHSELPLNLKGSLYFLYVHKWQMGNNEVRGIALSMG